MTPDDLTAQPSTCTFKLLTQDEARDER